ncbi:TrbI/VirB10 family protein [uncultured Selenomonas sp.]|uniref:TrbI/VirB10 family protein n=1 Tax=uncultured Selenomonas sp. TaxID=159275 RepID=UPI0028D468BB|nr:TrbI/VirB10 family protein [uncultured Selenomonas sp.]
MDMEKLKGKFQDLGRYFGGKKQDGDYDDEGEQKGFLARLFSRKKNTGETGEEDAGDVQLSGGGHKPVYGIRRKIIAGAFVALMLTFALSYAFFNDTDEKTQQMKPHPQQQAANEPADKNKQQQEPSYKDLEAINRRNQTQAGQKPGANTAQQNAQNAQNVQNAAGSAGRTTTPTAIAQPVQQPQLSLPSAYAMPAAPAAAPSGETGAAPAKEKDNLEQRFASAIDFALGKSQSADAAQSAAPVPAAPGNADASANLLQVASFSPASASPYVVQAGTLIPAILFSGINTDTPGQVIAQTSAPVYDSLYQSNLLIPAGSRLIGTYTSDGNIANGRIHVKFSTVIFPSGEAFNIGESILAVDGGYNGIVGKVNRHTARVVGAGVFSSAIAALGSLASGNTNTTNTYSAGQLAMQGAMANLIQTTSKLFEAGANVQPTVTVEPGHTFQLFVAQPISFGSSV